jgi:hypothetical protein
MYSYHHHSALVVVVSHGPNDMTRTTWPEAAEARRYIRKLLEQGLPPRNIRVYRTRLVRPPVPSY